MIPKLMAEVKKWNQADTVIKSIPALHYIAVTAQGAPGKDGKWRYRMNRRASLQLPSSAERIKFLAASTSFSEVTSFFSSLSLVQPATVRNKARHIHVNPLMKQK